MNKQEFITALEKLKLPKSEFIIISGGSLLLHNLRKTTADLDLCISEKLAEKINIYDFPKDEHNFFRYSENCQMVVGLGKLQFDIIDDYQCETLENILAFKRKLHRQKDLKDIENIEHSLRFKK